MAPFPRFKYLIGRTHISIFSDGNNSEYLNSRYTPGKGQMIHQYGGMTNSPFTDSHASILLCSKQAQEDKLQEAPLLASAFEPG